MSKEREREALAEDIYLLAKQLKEIQARARDTELVIWRKHRFLGYLSSILSSLLQAMDCLSPDVSPDTDALVEQLVQRFREDPEGRDELVEKLKVGFNKAKEERQ